MYDPLLTIGTVIFEAANFVYPDKRFEFEGAAWGGVVIGAALALQSCNQIACQEWKGKN